MPDAEFPEQHRRDEEQAREQWKKNIKCRRSVPQKVQQRVILYQRIGNYKCREQEYFFPVNADRIFAEFSCAVRKDIHKFQTVQRKKTKRRLNKNQAEENGSAADKHKNDGQNFGETPGNIAFGNTVNEHDDSL